VTHTDYRIFSRKLPQLDWLLLRHGRHQARSCRQCLALEVFDPKVESGTR